MTTGFLTTRPTKTKSFIPMNNLGIGRFNRSIHKHILFIFFITKNNITSNIPYRPPQLHNNSFKDYMLHFGNPNTIDPYGHLPQLIKVRNK